MNAHRIKATTLNAIAEGRLHITELRPEKHVIITQDTESLNYYFNPAEGGPIIWIPGNDIDTFVSTALKARYPSYNITHHILSLEMKNEIDSYLNTIY